MSPRTCSQPGLRVRLRLSIWGERSESVHVNRSLRWEALLPPPEPSSRSVCASGSSSRIASRYRAASSA